MRRIRCFGSVCLLAFIGAAVALSGCGDDSNPAANAGDGAPSRSTPEELLSDYFKAAYDGQDSSAYAAMLDDDFRFVFLTEDAEGLPVGERALSLPRL